MIVVDFYFYLTITTGDEDVADLLRGDVAVLEAAKRGSIDKIRKLITPANINCRDSQGRNSTPLHLAGERCIFCITITVINVEVAEFLLENGADVNSQDKGGLIPLHNAASYCFLYETSIYMYFQLWTS
jgi:tankyrase